MRKRMQAWRSGGCKRGPVEGRRLGGAVNTGREWERRRGFKGGMRARQGIRGADAEREIENREFRRGATSQGGRIQILYEIAAVYLRFSFF